jgi:hypothetical protein
MPWAYALCSHHSFKSKNLKMHSLGLGNDSVIPCMKLLHLGEIDPRCHAYLDQSLQGNNYAKMRKQYGTSRAFLETSAQGFEARLRNSEWAV